MTDPSMSKPRYLYRDLLIEGSGHEARGEKGSVATILAPVTISPR